MPNSYKHSLIVACDRELGIGREGAIPWHYTEDMKFFAETTNGATCIMGRRTYEEIYTKLNPAVEKPLLPNRTCIILSSDADFRNSVSLKNRDTFGVPDIHAAFNKASGSCFIIGGAALYEEGIKHVNSVYITDIPGTHECDVKLSDEFIRILLMKFEVDSERVSESRLMFTKYRRKGA